MLLVNASMSEAEGLIVAAIIAGLVAFFSLIIGKEQTVSDCRQKWIDALRKDIASIVACVTGIHGESIAPHGEHVEPLWARLKAELTLFNELKARIRLRLNPKEKSRKEGPATKAILDVLKDLESMFGSPQPEFHRINSLLDALVSQSQTILKANWERVRNGEWTYRITKWATIVLTTAAVAWFIWRYF